MRVTKIISTTAPTGGEGPVDGANISGTLNSAWMDMQNTRDDKVILMLQWDGTGAFTMRMHGLMDQDGTTVSPSISPGLVTYVPMDAVNPATELDEQVMVTGGGVKDGPFTYSGDATGGGGGTFHAYMSKLPRMRLQIRNVSGSPSINAWLIG